MSYQNHHKITAMLCMCALLLTLLSTVAYTSAHAHHNHTGAHCETCAAMAVAVSKTCHTCITAEKITLAMPCCLASAILQELSDFHLTKPTLVSLKSKLSN